MKTSIASAIKDFRPGLAPTLVVLVLLPLMVGLGCWQVSRGHEKQRLVDSYAERRVAEPISSMQLNEQADPAFRRVHLRGLFDAEHSVLLVALDGEERGLLGAREFVRAPPVPLSAIALNLNFDMIARAETDNRLWVTGTYQHPTLRPILETVTVPIFRMKSGMSIEVGQALVQGASKQK